MKKIIQSNKLTRLNIYGLNIYGLSIYGYKKLISDHGGDVNNIIIIHNGQKLWGFTAPLLNYYVAHFRNLEIVKYLVEEKGADVKATDDSGYSVLHYAVRYGNLDLVKYLIKKGADVKANYISGVKANYLAGDSVLHYAVRYGNLDLVKYLVEEKGADVKATNNSGDSVLHYAVVSGNLDIVKYLIEAKGADVKATDKYGVSVLTRAASCKGLDIVKYLIEAKGADVKATDKNGNSILHYAVSSLNLKVIKYLIEKGADVKATNNSGGSVLHYAVRYQNLESVSYIKGYIGGESDAELRTIPNVSISRTNAYYKIAVAGILNFGSYIKDMLPARISSACGAVSNSLVKVKGIETIVNGVTESLGVSAKAANALKANFVLALPVTIIIAAGKAVGNFIKAKKSRIGMLEATAESLYDTGALLAQSTAGVAGAALGAAVIGGGAAPLVASFGAVYGIGEVARHAKPVVGKFTSKIASEVSSKLGYSK